MNLNHVGIVVRDLVQQGESYRRILAMAPDSEIILDPVQNVRAWFWRDKRGSRVELLEPTGSESPVWRESQKGGGLHHLCYETGRTWMHRFAMRWPGARSSSGLQSQPLRSGGVESRFSIFSTWA